MEIRGIDGGRQHGGGGVNGQGWVQLEELGLAFVLSALVGLEREIRQKSAGLRTYTLIGVSSALFMLISKYGFTDILANNRIVLDPSRVAAQIVSGIGFIGGGVIFMRRDVVRGLTTAASVWLTAALGMACGAGLLVLAAATTAIHFMVMLVFPRLVRSLPRERRTASRLRISYEDSRGLLRAVLVTCTEMRFAIDQVDVLRDRSTLSNRDEAVDAMDREGSDVVRAERGVVVMTMRVKGKRPVTHLIARLGEMDGIVGVESLDGEQDLD